MQRRFFYLGSNYLAKLSKLVHYYLDVLRTLTTYQYEYYVTRTTTWMPVALMSTVLQQQQLVLCRTPYTHILGARKSQVTTTFINKNRRAGVADN